MLDAQVKNSQSSFSSNLFIASDRSTFFSLGEASQENGRALDQHHWSGDSCTGKQPNQARMNQ